MTDAERIWREKSDDDLLVAAAELDTYTDAGQRIIREELRRRGLEDPVDQARFMATDPAVEPLPKPKAGSAEAAGDMAPPAPRCYRCKVEQAFMGTKRFREGSNWGALGELGHLFEHSESFDVYACPRCGHVDLFVDSVGEDEAE